MVAANHILQQAPSILQNLTGMSVTDIKQEQDLLQLRIRDIHISVAAGNTSRAAIVAKAAHAAKIASQQTAPSSIPLVAVPFMGQTGREICREQGVGFVDLSGNAEITAPGLRVSISGKPNQFLQRGRPSSVFAPKSSRIARLLLLDPSRRWRQTELSQHADLGRGYVSRICERLAEDRLIARDNDGTISPRDPDLLLQSWQQQYDLNRHYIIKGHVPARAGQELQMRVIELCNRYDLHYALTGLAAASILAPFADFRLVTLYVAKLPDAEFFNEAQWHDDPRGSNLWILLPNDDGVFHGSVALQNNTCVCPVQAYLDLQQMPERSQDAAQHLRTEQLKWQ